jgi:hypothetical protein
MNRTLKRPMFRMGGSIGTGITSGLDKPRKQFSEGTNNPLLQYPTDYFPELGVKKQETTPSITIDKPQETTSMLPSEQLMKAFADRDTKPDLSQFLINFGLNLASATPRGNIIATAAEAAKAPTDTLFKQIGAEKAFDRQLALSGAEMDINERLKKEAAQRKFEQDLALQLAKPQKVTYRAGVDTRTGERGFFTNADIEASGGAIQPIDNRMGFVFDAKTQTLKQVPLSDLDRAKDKKEEATAIATQYNILNELVSDMQTRLPGLVTGPTGNIFGFVEGSADQFRQIAESLGVRDGLVIEDDSVINKYLKDKGFTEKASDFAQMKSSVINLGYALAKIAEPDNPRLSEGDIIRQLNRINFGSSRKVFSDSLNQILKEELIRARAEIKGKELNPEDFLNILKEDKKQDKKINDKKTTEDSNDPANIR